MASSLIIPDWAHLFAEGVGWCSLTCFSIMFVIIAREMWVDWKESRRK